MRLMCPSCDLAYDVPDALLVRPRPLRCSQCGHTWLPDQLAEPVLEPVPEAAEPPADEPPPEPQDHPPPPLPQPAMLPEPVLDGPGPRLRLAEPPPKTRGHLGVAAAWAASVALLVGAGWSAYTYRDTIMSSWPPSQRLYEGFGLTPDGQAAASHMTKS